MDASALCSQAVLRDPRVTKVMVCAKQPIFEELPGVFNLEN